MIAAAVYLLCAFASTTCAFLLLRSYHRGGHRFLLWCGICFVGLAANNSLLVLDRLVVRDVDLSTWRLVPTFVGVAVIIYGLVWDEE